jgi:hypothetical protein
VPSHAEVKVSLFIEQAKIRASDPFFLQESVAPSNAVKPNAGLTRPSQQGIAAVRILHETTKTESYGESSMISF